MPEVVPGYPNRILPVNATYGWRTDLTDEQILEHLFKLNQELAAAQ